jgi:Mg2+/Co2+ transporter CorB
VVLTLIVLIFAEVTPKTIAALYPERIAYPSSLLLALLLKVLYPVVWVVNFVSNGLVRLLGFTLNAGDSQQQLTQEELRTVVYESSERIPRRRHGMLLNILDLEKATVNDILVPRNEILGLDIEEDLGTLLDQIAGSQHTRMPVYRGDIDNIVGILHLRSVGKLLKVDNLNKALLVQESNEPYFIPESTPLHTQLFNFQTRKLRMAVVVDEYGAVKGIVTLEDILEEIVGEFTTDLAASSKDIHAQVDGSFLIDGATSIREINRTLGWDLDGGNAKTINGLLMEILQSIPDSSVGVKLDGYYAEIVQTKDNVIRTVRMRPVPTTVELLIDG